MMISLTSSLKKIASSVSLVISLFSPLAIAPALAEDIPSDRAEFPGRRIGGGTRSACAAKAKSLIALNPTNNLGMTASSRPSLYFAIPPLESSYPVQFFLQDEAGNPVYETTTETENTQQLLGIQLPEGTLEVGQDYRWYFAFACNPADPSQSIVLSGWLRQVASDLPVDTDEAANLNTRLAQIDSYQDSELWNDAIAGLVQLQQQYPENPDVQNRWIDLLQALELEMLIEQSVANEMQ
ncbi:DUF928 domain-containing protein [Roseofilum capinflatum]|uniref:DUF928 domain-containing protein n=1 Tax=Roseofilum capinflatum BLCC-M114 TaxID=3022440 RepID=A0ABT7B8Q0_9CYAN|nr:DUF928 domain-containing protein [Roseofilum capinflatum]MDJ1175560.1 DUF928 domain-containing protein [Roseofilum capinflatum BLCC-M114]